MIFRLGDVTQYDQVTKNTMDFFYKPMDYRSLSSVVFLSSFEKAIAVNE